MSPFSIITKPALVAASLVTSWSPAKAEIIGQPFNIRLTWEKAEDRDCESSITHFKQKKKKKKINDGFRQPHLNCLPVVGLHNMEAEAVHASPRCQEDAGLLVKVSSHVHQDLTGLARMGRATWCESSTEWRVIINNPSERFLLLIMCHS